MWLIFNDIIWKLIETQRQKKEKKHRSRESYKKYVKEFLFLNSIVTLVNIVNRAWWSFMVALFAIELSSSLFAKGQQTVGLIVAKPKTL